MKRKGHEATCLQNPHRADETIESSPQSEEVSQRSVFRGHQAADSGADSCADSGADSADLATDLAADLATDLRNLEK